MYVYIKKIFVTCLKIVSILWVWGSFITHSVFVDGFISEEILSRENDQKWLLTYVVTISHVSYIVSLPTKVGILGKNLCRKFQRPLSHAREHTVIAHELWIIVHKNNVSVCVDPDLTYNEHEENYRAYFIRALLPVILTINQMHWRGDILPSVCKHYLVVDIYLPYLVCT